MSRDIILLIGQSNMAGRGRPNEVDPIADERIETFRDGQWQRAVEPLHDDKETAGVGLAMSCASAYLEAFPHARIGLVPSAVGGTPLSRWMPGEDLYQRALGIAREALAGGALKAILWHQGETDAQHIELAQSYGQRLAEMVVALRRALDAPDVPLVVGGLGDFLAAHPTCVHHALVNDALQNLRVDRCGFASASGLGEFDGIHFDSSALRIFGQRYAAELLRLIKE